MGRRRPHRRSATKVQNLLDKTENLGDFELFRITDPRSAMMNSTGAPAATYEVGAVRKALEILCQFDAAHPAHAVSDLSRSLKIPKSTVHNLLRTLEHLDFLRQDPSDRSYRLGPRVFELGLVYSNKTSLTSVAYPHMQKLAEATNETVKVGVSSSGDVVILAAIESRFQLHTRGDEGIRAPLHCTGLGKAILSTLDNRAVREAVAARGLPAMTPHTITDVDALLVELEKTRKRRYALDIEENERGVVCAAAPIANPAQGITAAVSVSAPASRMNPAQLEACAELVTRTSKLIAASLNGFGATRRIQRRTNEDCG